MSLKTLFMKYGDVDAQAMHTAFLTIDQFRKCVMGLLRDLSSREAEQVFKCLNAKKPLTLKHFEKVFSHKAVKEEWKLTGIKLF